MGNSCGTAALAASSSAGCSAGSSSTYYYTYNPSEEDLTGGSARQHLLLNPGGVSGGIGAAGSNMYFASYSPSAFPSNVTVNVGGSGGGSSSGLEMQRTMYYCCAGVPPGGDAPVSPTGYPFSCCCVSPTGVLSHCPVSGNLPSSCPPSNDVPLRYSSAAEALAKARELRDRNHMHQSLEAYHATLTLLSASVPALRSAASGCLLKSVNSAGNPAIASPLCLLGSGSSDSAATHACRKDWFSSSCATGSGRAEQECLMLNGGPDYCSGASQNTTAYSSEASSRRASRGEGGGLAGCSSRNNISTSGLCCSSEAAAVCDEIAELYLVRKRPSESVHWYSKAMELQPSCPVYIYKKGVVLQQQSRMSEAVQHFEMALELDPHYKAALFNLGATQLHRRKLPEALKCFETLLELESTDAAGEVLMLISQCYELQGHYAEALSHLNRVLDLDPSNFAAKRTAANLNKMLNGGKNPTAILRKGYQTIGKEEPCFV